MRLFLGMALTLVLYSVLMQAARAEQVAVLIDGTYEDWNSVSPAYTDAGGDGGVNGVDFGRMWLADDNRFLFVRIELGTEMDISENNSLILYLDTDSNSSTGLAVGGIKTGADRVGLSVSSQ